MTPNPLDAIQARADAATEGPWEAIDAFDENGEDWLYSEIRHTYRADGIVWPNQILGTTDLEEADAEFIAHAREDVPKLVEALRAVEAIKPWNGDYPPYDNGYNTALQDVQRAIREALA